MESDQKQDHKTGGWNSTGGGVLVPCVCHCSWQGVSALNSLFL